jgi:hypothetical protein
MTTKVPTVPPVTVTALEVNVEDASDRVIVSVEVCPIFRIELDALNVAEGLT